jgi:hypothetical protein
MTTSDLAAASAGVKIKNRVRATINERRKTFIELAHDIHQHPELAFSETYAADRITSSSPKRASLSCGEFAACRPLLPPLPVMDRCMSPSVPNTTRWMKGSATAAVTT